MRRAVQLHRLACGMFLVSTALALLVARSPPGTRGVRYIALHLVLTAFMLVAWATARAPETWRTTLVAGVLARLVLLPVPSFTSTDAVRYLFDGAVVLTGFDPYRVPPDAPVLTGLRATWPLPDVQRNVPTVYPPGGLGLFALAAVTGPAVAPWVWKAMTTLASLGVLGLSARLLGATGGTRHLALVALSPLLVLEGGIGAHLDLFAAVAVAAALLLARRGDDVSTGVALGIGALVKLLPGLAVVPLAAAARRPRRVVAGAIGAVAVGYGAALLLGLRPIGGLSSFFVESRFGSPLGILLAGSVLPPLLLTVALVRAGRLAEAGRHAHGVQLALAAPLVVGPVAFPWYLVALVPALGLAPSALVLAWLAASPLTYEVIDREATLGVWAPAVWPLWVIAAAAAVGFAVDRALARRRSSTAGSASRPG